MTLALRKDRGFDRGGDVGHDAVELRIAGERPRIGIAIHDFALGGTERIAVRLANAWSSMGIAVDLFCGSAKGPLHDLLDSTVQVTSPATPIERQRGSLKRLGQAARTHFERTGVDAVYVPGNYHWPIVAALGQIPSARRPTLIVQVSAALSKPQRGRLHQCGYEIRMRQKLRKADFVITLSDETALTAARILRRKDVRMIPLPALNDELPPPAASLENGSPTILVAARLVRGKGILALINAFAQLAHPTARLLIAGYGPDEAGLHAVVTALNLDRQIQFLGYVPCIRPWLDRSNFLVLPSEFEGYPAVLIEALAAGRPVLATDCSPAIRELLGDRVAGEVVPIRDVGALENGLRKMISRPAPDPQVLVQKIERFRIGPVAEAYLELMATKATPRRLNEMSLVRGLAASRRTEQLVGIAISH